jgi:flagellar biosynthesis/type III secretory pathway M-ring protein FliF/YscJ
MEINNMINNIIKKWNAWSTSKKTAVVAVGIAVVILLLI